MATLRKPTSRDELPAPFEHIGESGWAARALQILREYDVPLPDPIAASAVSQRETELGIEFPAPYKELLCRLGPVDVDGFRFLPLRDVVPVRNIWFRDRLRAPSAQLDDLFQIVDYLGSGDVVAMDRWTGRCCLCGHDPPELSNWLPSVDALVKIIFLTLPSSYYGWPDGDVRKLTEAVQMELFGTSL